MEENKKRNSKSIIIGVIVAVVLVALASCFVIAYNNIQNSNTIAETTSQSTTNSTKSKTTSTSAKSTSSNGYNITSAGTYDLSGSYEAITVNADGDVTLNLNEVEINSTDGPGINIESADTVTIVLSGNNTITAETTEDLDGAIYSKADLVFEGTGSLEIKSNYDGIVSKDTLVIKNGNYTISSDDDAIRGKDSVEIEDGTFTLNAGGDGIKASNDTDTTLGYVVIKGGNFNINAKSDGVQGITKATIEGGTFNITSAEGIEATYVKIDGGTINIEASDDGINASQKSTSITPTVEINGGDITIKMGQGDTDAIDSNGSIYINGGTINITANSPFDYDKEAQKNGGTLIINGTETDTITNQMMGGGMQGGGQFEKGQKMNPNGQMPDGEMPTGEIPSGNMQNGGGPRGRR